MKIQAIDILLLVAIIAIIAMVILIKIYGG